MFKQNDKEHILVSHNKIIEVLIKLKTYDT